MLESRKEQAELFDEKVNELATKAGLQQIEVFPGNENNDGEVGFPCFLQFTPKAIEDCEKVSEEKGEIGIGIGTQADTEPENSDVKDQFSETMMKNIEAGRNELECSPKGDAAS